MSAVAWKALAAEIDDDPDFFIDERDRRRLLAFTRRMFPGYEPAPHHERIAEHLHAVERGELDRLIVTMPPRHGKSTLVSEHFPAWFLGRNPDKRVIACSHTAALANVFSRRARNKIADPRWPFPAVRVAGDLASVQKWDIEGHRGGYVAAGVGGSITGMGSDCLIIDDPVKSSAEADSETYRDAAWDWFTATALTRIEPGGAAVVVGTRWHEDDLIGRIRSGPDAARWTVLDLPALDDDDQALWPERFPAEALAAIQREIGSRNFAALYQGRPSPASGNVLKRDWWKFSRIAPEDLTNLTQSWDMSFRETKAGSYIVGQVWGAKGANRYLLDQVRFRGDFPAALHAVRSLTAKWPTARAKLVEDKANGPAIVAALKHEISGLIEVSPEGGKLARASAVAPQIEAGNVYLPEPSATHPWVHDFIEECAAFPAGAHDDQVDAMSQALARMAATARPTAAPVGIGRESAWIRPGGLR